MYSHQIKALEGGQILKYVLADVDGVITYGQFITLLKENQTFRDYFIDLLEKADFGTYRWETPAVTLNTIDQPFEFVLVNSPGLAANPDRYTFQQYFVPADQNNGVVVFDNLGRDAVLVVPSPQSTADSFPHLAQFIRTASSPQRHSLWKSVAEAMFNRISDIPVWLSTAGGGVSWLHVRLDDRPKYYWFAPYRIRP